MPLQPRSHAARPSPTPLSPFRPRRHFHGCMPPPLRLPCRWCSPVAASHRNERFRVTPSFVLLYVCRCHFATRFISAVAYRRWHAYAALRCAIMFSFAMAPEDAVSALPPLRQRYRYDDFRFRVPPRARACYAAAIAPFDATPMPLRHTSHFMRLIRGCLNDAFATPATPSMMIRYVTPPPTRRHRVAEDSEDGAYTRHRCRRR